MKKSFSLFVIISFFTASQIAAQAFQKGTGVGSAGIGFGSSIGSHSGTQTPAISIQYEQGLWPLGSDGVISLGGYAGYKAFQYKYDAGSVNYKQNWNYTIIGARAAYHYTGLENEKIDVYGGLMLSYNILKYKFKDNSGSGSGIYNSGSYGSAAGFTAYAGGRYFFSNNLGAFAELGYGVSYLTVGLSLKF